MRRYKIIFCPQKVAWGKGLELEGECRQAHRRQGSGGALALQLGFPRCWGHTPPSFNDFFLVCSAGLTPGDTEDSNLGLPHGHKCAAV